MFLSKDNLCKIHEVKPIGGRICECWDENNNDLKSFIWEKEDLFNLGWKGEPENEDYFSEEECEDD